MEWIKKIVIRLIGKKINAEGTAAAGSPEKWELSKAKITAVVYVLVLAAQEIPKAWGHPIIIPPAVFDFLKAAGLWTLRDAIKT